MSQPVALSHVVLACCFPILYLGRAIDESACMTDLLLFRTFESA